MCVCDTRICDGVPPTATAVARLWSERASNAMIVIQQIVRSCGVFSIMGEKKKARCCGCCLLLWTVDCCRENTTEVRSRVWYKLFNKACLLSGKPLKTSMYHHYTYILTYIQTKLVRCTSSRSHAMSSHELRLISLFYIHGISGESSGWRFP